MKKNTTLVLLVVILLAAFFLYQYKLLEFPYYGDEVDGGDITVKILNGQIAPFFPEGDGHEALYNYSMALLFLVMGESEIASRWASVAWAMVTVALMYVYGQRMFKRRRVGVMAAGLTAALLWPALYAHLSLRVVTLSAVTIPALCGLVLLLRAATEPRALHAAIVGGLFAGLSAYTYTSGRGFPAVVLAFLVYIAVVERDLLVKRWRPICVYMAVLALASAWLYAYLLFHPEFDNRIRDMAQTSWFFGGDWSGLGPAVQQTLEMFTIRGEPNWVNNVSERPVFAGPEGILFYLGILFCVLRLRKPEFGLQLILIGAHMIPSIITEHPPSWGRSMGMLPAVIVVTTLPVEWAWGKLDAWRARQSTRSMGLPGGPGGRARLAGPAFAALVALLGISIYARTAFDLFEVWMKAPGVYWMSLAFYDETAKYINRAPESTPLDFSMEWYVPWRRTNIKRPVQRSDVALRWTVNNAFVFPDDARGLRVAFQFLADPARALQDAFLDLDDPIYVDSRVDPEGQRPLRVYYIPRSRLDEHLATAAKSLPGDTAIVTGDLLEFKGYEIHNPQARTGDTLNIFTYWHVLRPLPDMAVFVHLVDADNRIVAQYDGLDVVRDDVVANDIIVQLHALKLPADLPAGDYRFEVGAYRRADGQRLALSSGGDSVIVGGWTVGR